MHRSPPRAEDRPIDRAALVRIAAALALGLACALAAGCSKGTISRPNMAPTLTLTSGPVDTVSTPQHWVVDIAWTANDPDGRIDHFEYAVDPPPLKQARFALAETTWTSTTETHAIVRFRASVPDSLGPGATASSFHTFVLRAFDDRGGVSPTLVRAFYASTVAPDVQITHPQPNEILETLVPVPFRVDWTSNDPDGETNGHVAFHRVRMLDMSDPDNVRFRYDPDSLLKLGIATEWLGWQVVGGDTTSLVLDGPPPGGEALFAVVAVDEAGATTPYLTYDRNLLQYATTSPDLAGPRIRVISPFVDFEYQSGGWSVDPLREIPVEVGHHPSEFHWTGYPAAGRHLHSSRWKLNGDPLDDTPRVSPNDLEHWSDSGPPGSSAQLPALAIGVHRLYIEVRDDFGDRSLAIVRLTVIEASLDHELLVIDDTRREVDKFNTPGTPNTYRLPWPSAAELDTFLYARGGMPWRATKNPTSGVITPPGLLAGYPFDTLGTRLGLEDPTRAVTLQRLGAYRHVLWIVDEIGAGYPESADQLVFPVSVLRAISGPGRANVLGAYVELGGRVWLAGGGAALASLITYDRARNNVGASLVISSDLDELGPGRTMYDHAHVRSSMAFAKTFQKPTRSAAAIGGWSGHGPAGTLSAPDYSKLPATMRLREPGTDPMPPTRPASQTNLYYLTATTKEFVLGPNEIVEEDMNPDPIVVQPASTLDTLYEAPDPLASDANGPVMLYYHGRDNEPFVFTGFDLWTWTRADCQALVDFVLGDIWGLPKNAAGPRNARANAASARSVGPRQTDAPAQGIRKR